jgi:hypothetical protein
MSPRRTSPCRRRWHACAGVGRSCRWWRPRSRRPPRPRRVLRSNRARPERLPGAPLRWPQSKRLATALVRRGGDGVGGPCSAVRFRSHRPDRRRQPIPDPGHRPWRGRVPDELGPAGQRDRRPPPSGRPPFHPRFRPARPGGQHPTYRLSRGRANAAAGVRPEPLPRRPPRHPHPPIWKMWRRPSPPQEHQRPAGRRPSAGGLAGAAADGVAHQRHPGAAGRRSRWTGHPSPVRSLHRSTHRPSLARIPSAGDPARLGGAGGEGRRSIRRRRLPCRPSRPFRRVRASRPR